MKLIEKIKNNKILVAFLLSGLLGCLIVLPNIIINGGIYSLTKDLSFEQIPFNKLMNYSIKNGEIFWTWYNDLGSNFIGTFSFYNLFSPFNLIGYLFPESIYEYLLGPIYILKYAVSGLTSYLYLKRYVKNKNYAILGSLLYTFSGYMLTNILFFHFHDVVAFFPLLLLTLDNLIYDNKKGRFALAVSLCAFTNWFFFIGECVFLIIYFLVKVITKEYKINLKKFINIIIEGLIGCGLAMLVLIPSALFTLGNTRLDNKWTLLTIFIHQINYYIEIIRSFIFPSEVMSIRGIITQFNYRSIELYLPLVGSVLAISYFIKHKKSWESKLILILIIFMFIPILNSSFILFQNTYYARWFFMPILILALMSIKCLEEKIDIKPGIKISLITGVIFIILTVLFSFILKNKYQVIYDMPYFIMTIIFMLLNLLIIYIINKNKNITKQLIIGIFVFITIWGNINVYYYKEKNITTKENYFEYLKSNNIIEIEPNVRTNSTASCDYNYGYIIKNNNIRVFNSNINAGAFKFYKTVGVSRKVKTKINIKRKDLNDFLGVKYIISCGDDQLNDYGYTLYKEYENYKIYINKDYKEFGFAVNEYITEEEFNELSKDEKQKTILSKVILSQEQIEKYKYILNNPTKAHYYTNKFEFTKNGFKSNINSSKETLAIYQFPYDKGWTATINGKSIEIEEVDGGLIGIKLSEGVNEIEFKYRTPGLKLGIIISIISLLSYIIYIVINKKNKGVEV